MDRGGRCAGLARAATIAGLITLAACGPAEPPGEPPAAAVEPIAPAAIAPPPAPGYPAPPGAVEGPQPREEEPPPPPDEPPRAARAPGDLPPCPGINPDIRRPAGSNCLGILPAECGADAAQAFVGRAADPGTRTAVAEAVGHARIRWIAPREAVTDDLRPDRLNMMLDARGRIADVDCH